MDLDAMDESSQSNDFSHTGMVSSGMDGGLSLALPTRSNTIGSTSPSRFIEGSITFRGGNRPPTPDKMAPPPPVRTRSQQIQEQDPRLEQMRQLQEMQRKLRQQQIEQQDMVCNHRQTRKVEEGGKRGERGRGEERERESQSRSC